MDITDDDSTLVQAIARFLLPGNNPLADPMLTQISFAVILVCMDTSRKYNIVMNPMETYINFILS